MPSLLDSVEGLRGLLDGDDEIAKRLNLPHPKRLTGSQWRRVELALQRWSERLVKAGRLQPPRSYQHGLHQAMRLLLQQSLLSLL